MKLQIFGILFCMVVLVGSAPVFAEKIIVSEGKELEISEITEERKYRLSHISKVQGFTTTGDMFFIFTSELTDFEKVMLLDREGQWRTAELLDKQTVESEPVKHEIPSTEIHFLVDQHERVYNKELYKFFVKTFDSSIYNGNNFDNFQGKIDGVTINALITDPDGEVKADFSGITENGIYEGSVTVPENLWQRGWYTLDIAIEYEGQFQFETMTFYVYGTVVPDNDSP